MRAVQGYDVRKLMWVLLFTTERYLLAFGPVPRVQGTMFYHVQQSAKITIVQQEATTMKKGWPKVLTTFLPTNTTMMQMKQLSER